jgi:hypothetical protein
VAEAAATVVPLVQVVLVVLVVEVQEPEVQMGLTAQTTLVVEAEVQAPPQARSVTVEMVATVLLLLGGLYERT